MLQAAKLPGIKLLLSPNVYPSKEALNVVIVVSAMKYVPLFKHGSEM